MKFVILSVLVSLTNFAYAQDFSCDSSRKIHTIDMTGVSIRGSFKSGDGFLVKDDKVLEILNQCQADYACKQLNARLPTARELAIDATKMGAEISDLDPNQPEVFNPIEVVNSDGKKDHFYYKYYYGKLGDDKNRFNSFVWSSSYHVVREGYKYGLDTYSGSIGYYSPYDEGAARCLTTVHNKP